MKKLLPIILMQLIFLCGCSSSNNKSEAYCFSMVFEKISGTPNVTMYCKIQNSDDASKLDNTSFTFSGQTLTDALLSSAGCDYEMYFNSTKALYFSPDITNEEFFEIMTYFLNHTKYQSSVYIYMPDDNKLKDATLIKKEAEEVCKNEKISYTKRNNYIFSVKAIRNIFC